MAADVRFVDAQRLGVLRAEASTWTSCSSDDYDLQIVRALASGPLSRSRRRNACPFRQDRLANAVSLLRRVRRNLTASRVSADKVRTVPHFRSISVASVDMQSQSIRAYRLSRETGAPEIVPVPVPVEPHEPLAREMADFVRAVRHRSVPLVSGETGREALALAVEVQDALERHRVEFGGASE